MSAEENVVLMNQYASLIPQKEDVIEQSGFAHISMVEPQGDNQAVSLVALPVMGLLSLRAGDEAERLGKALKANYDMDLPARLQSHTTNDLCVRWMSPDHWLLSCPLEHAHAIEYELRRSVEGHIAIVNVSGGYSGLHLIGSEALSVLMKSTGYDVHPHNFEPGKVVNTVFAKAQVTMRCLASDHYELLVRRSFADYLWQWLQNALPDRSVPTTWEPDAVASTLVAAKT